MCSDTGLRKASARTSVSKRRGACLAAKATAPGPKQSLPHVIGTSHYSQYDANICQYRSKTCRLPVKDFKVTPC